MKAFAHLTLVGVLLIPSAFAQHTWQKPKPLKPKAEIDRIIGPLSNTTPSRPIHVLWVWGFDKWHAPGAHDYERIRDLMTGLLKQVPQVSTETVYDFPSKQQFDRADLVCLYLHLPQLSDQQYSDFSQYIENGGGVVSIHETCIMRPPNEGRKLAACLGRAWNDDRSEWGAIFDQLRIDNRHEIFKGFNDKLTIMDEFYWNLFEEDENVKPLAWVKVGPPEDSKGPVPPNTLSEKEWPVFWTYTKGQGRVFATSTGHHSFSYYDPELRIILFRGMAWALREKPDPFMPLVYEGISHGNSGIGTTETMRGWKGKRRAP